MERHAAGCKRVHPPQQKYLGQGAARVPREVRNLMDGGQEGESVTGRKPGKHLVPINQRPSNGDCWRVNSRSLTEKTHVGVQADGENHHEATHQIRQNIGGSIAHGVAIHLSVASRGEISGSTIVTIRIMHHLSASVGCNNHRVLRRIWNWVPARLVQRQRLPAHA